MANFIEAGIEGELPRSISMQKGDILSIPSTGGRLIGGAGVVELFGPFYPAFLNSGGEVIAPSGSPNQLLLLARQSGTAGLEVYMENVSQPILYQVTVV